MDGHREWKEAACEGGPRGEQRQVHIANEAKSPRSRRMAKKILKSAGVAAAILLAPGGFILGVALVANHYRKKASQASDENKREGE